MSSDGRRIAILCLDVDMLDDRGFVPFNYAARRIQAAVVSDPELADAEVKVFDGLRRSAEDVAQDVERFDPDVVGVSAYLWSFPTLLDACDLLKASRPDRTIVFGGPSARPAMFDVERFRQRAPVVDALVTRDGELAFRGIARLRDRSPDALRRVPGVTTRDALGWSTPVAAPDYELDSLASPYQLDLAPRGRTAHLETFRGCPLACAFCEWGVPDRASRVLSEEYLVRELEAFRRAGADGAFLVDAAPNLNSRAFRNLCAAEERVGFFKEAPLSCEVYPTHVKQDLLDFFSACRVHHVAIGVQSFNEKVLKYMERHTDVDRVLKGIHALAECVPCVLELIVGLPGDDPDSFMRTIDQMMELPCDAVVHHCLVLPDGLMTRAPEGADMSFDPVTLRMTSCRGWSRADLEQTLRRLDDLAGTSDGRFNAYSWRLRSHTEQRGAPTARQEVIDRALLDSVGRSVARETQGALGVARMWRESERIGVEVQTAAGLLVVEVRAAGDGAAYRIIGSLAFTYRTPDWGPLSAPIMRSVDGAMRGIAHALREAGISGPTHSVLAPASP